MVLDIDKEGCLVGHNSSVVQRRGSPNLSGCRSDTEAIDSNPDTITCRTEEAQLEWTISTGVRKARTRNSLGMAFNQPIASANALRSVSNVSKAAPTP